TLGASKPTGNIVPRTFEFAIPFEPDPYDPAKAKQLLTEAGYANGFDAGDLHAYPPYDSTTEAVANYLAAVGIRTRLRTMERGRTARGGAGADDDQSVSVVGAAGRGEAEEVTPDIRTLADQLWRGEIDTTTHHPVAILRTEGEEIADGVLFYKGLASANTID